MAPPSAEPNCCAELLQRLLCCCCCCPSSDAPPVDVRHQPQSRKPPATFPPSPEPKFSPIFGHELRPDSPGRVPTTPAKPDTCGAHGGLTEKGTPCNRPNKHGRCPTHESQNGPGPGGVTPPPGGGRGGNDEGGGSHPTPEVRPPKHASYIHASVLNGKARPVCPPFASAWLGMISLPPPPSLSASSPQRAPLPQFPFL